MWAVEIIVIYEPVEITLELFYAVVSFLSQGDLQELFEDRSVQPFGEAVRPGMLDLCVMMSDSAHFQEELEVVAASFPVGRELFAIVGQNSFDRNAVAGGADMFDEINSRDGRLIDVELSPAEGSGCITTGHLVDSSDALETTDVEGVDPYQFTGIIGVDVP